jgi:Tol biopolymer transport system component
LDPFWSPDGKRIGFLSGGRLLTIDHAGGTPQMVADVGRDWLLGSSGSWSSGGVIVFDVGAELRQVSARGGEPKPATHLDTSRGEIKHLWPQFLPDGRHFLYLAVSQQTANSSVCVGSLDSPETTRVMAGGLGAVFAEPGYLLYVRNGTLVAHPFDWKSAHLTGDPISLSEPVFAWATSFLPVSTFSIAGNTLAYRSGSLPPMQLVWFDRQGRRLGDFAEPAQYSGPALSPDGQRIAVAIADARTNLRDLWLLDQRGGNLRLTFDPKDDFNPVWSPDGTRIAFSSDRQGVRDLYIKHVNGREEELLFGSQSQKSVEDWSPDGKLILYAGDGAIWAVPVEGEHKPFRLAQGPSRYDQSKISPDGKWLAYRSSESGRYEVYVQAFPVAGARWQISTAGGWEPSWRRDGKELYFTLGSRLMAVDVKATSGGFEHGTPRLLFEVPFSPEVRRNRYLPSADGQKFLAVIVGGEGASRPIRVVLNWNAGLKR